MRTNSIELRQIMVNHISEFQSPTEYGLASDDWKGLITQKMVEVDTGHTGIAGKRQVEGATYLYTYNDISQFMIDEIKWDRKRVVDMEPDKLYDLYARMVGQAYNDIMSSRLKVERVA